MQGIRMEFKGVSDQMK